MRSMKVLFCSEIKFIMVGEGRDLFCPYSLVLHSTHGQVSDCWQAGHS